MSDNRDVVPDRLTGLIEAIGAALVKSEPEAPGWIYTALAHSLDELEEIVDAFESDPFSETGAEAISARAEIALAVWQSWAKSKG